MMHMDWLQKDGYRLRAPEPEDLDSMMQFENLPDLWELNNATGPYSRYALKQYIATNQNDIYTDGQLRLMIETPNKEVAGIIDLFGFEPFHNRAEVGIVIADKYRNLGIGQQSLLLLIEYSFNYLGLKQLYAHIDTTNHASRKLFKKCGFEECGLLKSWMRTGRDYRDVVMVQLINS
jgi:diamine N-acetyltransferase